MKQKLSGRAGDGNSITLCPARYSFNRKAILTLRFYKMSWNAFLLLIHLYTHKKKPKTGRRYCEIWKPSVFMWLAEEARRLISDLQTASLPTPSFPQTQKAVRAWLMDCLIIISPTWDIQLYSVLVHCVLVHYVLCLPLSLSFQFLLCAVAFDSDG